TAHRNLTPKPPLVRCCSPLCKAWQRWRCQNRPRSSVATAFVNYRLTVTADAVAINLFESGHEIWPLHVGFLTLLHRHDPGNHLTVLRQLHRLAVLNPLRDAGETISQIPNSCGLHRDT